MNFKDYIASIPDFPTEGVLFRDITPLMADGEAFHSACEELIAYAKNLSPDRNQEASFSAVRSLMN